MYWINTVAELLKIDIETAKKIVDEMECGGFDFSEASDSMLKKIAKATLKDISK